MSFELGSNVYGPGTWIRTLNRVNPEFMSFDVQKQLYELIITNVDKEELVVTGSEPASRLMNGACHIDFQYDVVLFGKKLCKVYQSNCYDSDKVNFYILEFQKEHYDPLDLLGGYSSKNLKRPKGIEMCEKIAERWKQDEEKRTAELRISTQRSQSSFLETFQNRGVRR